MSSDIEFWFEIIDLLYVDTFLLTFRHFMTPKALMNMLTEKYKNLVATLMGPVDADLVVEGQLPSMVMHRIVSVVKKWVRHCPKGTNNLVKNA
jgi:hypothetical protein